MTGNETYGREKTSRYCSYTLLALKGSHSRSRYGQIDLTNGPQMVVDMNTMIGEILGEITEDGADVARVFCRPDVLRRVQDTLD